MTCTTSTTTIDSYTDTPTSYSKQTYSYIALFTGVAVLEFGFQAKNSEKKWHLDDVSILNNNVSNSEMLVNGNFESGTLVGWQVQCRTTNACSGSGGHLSTATCNAGTYCYEGDCEGKYDFLRQAFLVTAGHSYTLSFWLKSDGHGQQYAYVDII
jgi:hypothetical protein